MRSMIELLQYPFLQRALIAGISLGLVCAMLGVFLVIRKMSLIGDGLAHISFGGIALGLSLGVYPLFIAIPTAIIASMAIHTIPQRQSIQGDAMIGILSSVGLAFGVIISSLSNGFNIDILSYLFGNILAITNQELIATVLISIIIISLIIVYYWELFALSFDREQAKLAGIPVAAMDILLSVLTALVVILGIQLAGSLLVSALIIIPASISLQISKSFQQTLILSALISLVTTLAGIFLSLSLNTPPGATMVILNGFLFGLVTIFKIILPRLSHRNM